VSLIKEAVVILFLAMVTWLVLVSVLYVAVIGVVRACRWWLGIPSACGRARDKRRWEDVPGLPEDGEPLTGSDDLLDWGLIVQRYGDEAPDPQRRAS
jgi:hypothetical protein